MEEWSEETEVARRTDGMWERRGPPLDCLGWCLFDLPEYYGQSVDCLRTSSMQDEALGLLLRRIGPAGDFMRIGVWKANSNWMMKSRMNLFWDTCVPTKIKLI